MKMTTQLRVDAGTANAKNRSSCGRVNNCWVVHYQASFPLHSIRYTFKKIWYNELTTTGKVRFPFIFYDLTPTNRGHDIYVRPMNRQKVKNSIVSNTGSHT